MSGRRGQRMSWTEGKRGPRTTMTTTLLLSARERRTCGAIGSDYSRFSSTQSLFFQYRTETWHGVAGPPDRWRPAY
eukprot:4942477-Prymnesium_polylepis.1